MKIIISIFLVLVFLCSGCSDDYIETFNENRNVFIGDWTAIEQYKQYNSDTLQIDIEREFNIVLNADGTGLEKLLFSSLEPNPISWFYQANPEKIIISSSVSGIVGNIFNYDIIEKDNNQMVWETQYLLNSPDPNDIISIETSRILRKN